MKFVCPVCARRFEITASGAARCEAGHSFDRSREGYYNLLLGASGGTHGDNREMLLARRRFLDTGAYEPLARAVADALLTHSSARGAVLDMGCGEGYYTEYVQRALGAAEISAFDISKEAVRLAAKRARGVSFAVASSYKIPAESASFSAAYNIFSPLALSETARVLEKGGVLVLAIPGAEHLFELKAAVYDKPYKNEPEGSELSGFTLISQSELSYDRLFSQKELGDLFMMTPYAYRTGAKEAARLSEISELKVGMRFIILVYKRT